MLCRFPDPALKKLAAATWNPDAILEEVQAITWRGSARRNIKAATQQSCLHNQLRVSPAIQPHECAILKLDLTAQESCPVRPGYIICGIQYKLKIQRSLFSKDENNSFLSSMALWLMCHSVFCLLFNVVYSLAQGNICRPSKFPGTPERIGMVEAGAWWR